MAEAIKAKEAFADTKDDEADRNPSAEMGAKESIAVEVREKRLAYLQRLSVCNSEGDVKGTHVEASHTESSCTT